jgi:hypothetical protein
LVQVLQLPELPELELALQQAVLVLSVLQQLFVRQVVMQVAQQLALRVVQPAPQVLQD